MFKKIFDKFKKKNETVEEENQVINEEVFEKQSETIEEKNDVITETIEEVNENTKDNNEVINESNIEKSKEIVEEKEEIVEEEIVEEEVIKEKEKIVEEEAIKEKEEIVEEEAIKEKEEIVEENEELNEGVEKPQFKISLFEKLKEGLNKTKKGITDKIDNVLKAYTKVDEDLLEELEEILITSDVGVNTTMHIIEVLRDKIKTDKIKEPAQVKTELKIIIEELLVDENSKLTIETSPTIIIMVGVNGVGKTTTIGKLSKKFKDENKKVLVAAGDTFRAAAIEQLEVWTKRSGVDIIKHQEGADPGAVVFDAIKASKARNIDVLICDTAGRLHNKSNLMNELSKIFKIIDREFSGAKKEVLLVVDATTGQNAVSQAKSFKEVCDLTGIVLTKLDGTAKGGVVLAVKNEVNVPLKLIGVGERVEDLQDFDAKNFVDALFGEN
ncbi:MAG: signal recognition particle-docking protein FtsY [Peptostreptococcaceae bacterium]